MAEVTGSILRVGHSVRSTTAVSTPGAMAATEMRAFASTASGATLMGFGTTFDVTLKNRAGTNVLGIGPNTTTTTLAGALVCGGAVSGFTTLSGGAEPFSYSMNLGATAVSQMRLATSSVYGVIGHKYSAGTTVITNNAHQPTAGTDSWSQSSGSFKSILLELDYTNGLVLKQANAGASTANYATFWGSALFTVLTDGSGKFAAGVALSGGTPPSNGIQFGSNAPGALADGQMWFDGTNWKGRTGGATKTFTIT